MFEVVVVVRWLGVDDRRQGEKDDERRNQERLLCILYVSLFHVLLLCSDRRNRSIAHQHTIVKQQIQ